MGILKRGRSAQSVRFRSKSAIAVYLGDGLIWDGRVHAYRVPPPAVVAVLAPVPVVRSSAVVVVPLPGRGYGEAAYPADMDAGVTIFPPAASVAVDAVVPGTANDRTMVVPKLTVTSTAFPAVGVAVTGAVVTAAVTSGTAEAFAPVVSATAAVTAPKASVVGEAKPATAVGGWTVNAVTASGSAAAVAPTYQIILFTDMQMIKTGSQSIAGTYSRITGMAGDSAYPESEVVNNALVVAGASSNATITVHAVGSKASTSYMVYFQVLRNGSIVGSEQVKSGSPNSFTFDFQFTGVTLADGDVVELQARRTGTASVLEGTYVRITA